MDNLEIWADIIDYVGLYKVSNKGRVYNTVTNTILAVYTDRGGYNKCTLMKDKQRKSCLLHRIVAKAFIPNHENKKTINHIDGDKSNNSVSNLEWATMSENSKHAWQTGLKKSSNNGRSKLTEADVLKIRERYAAGESGAIIAKSYGVSKQNVYVIARGTNWAYTDRDNIVPMHRVQVKGEGQHLAVTTTEKVLQLREIYKEQKLSMIKLGAMFGVSHNTARQIVNRITWKHI